MARLELTLLFAKDMKCGQPKVPFAIRSDRQRVVCVYAFMCGACFSSPALI